MTTADGSAARPFGTATEEPAGATRLDLPIIKAPVGPDDRPAEASAVPDAAPHTPEAAHHAAHHAAHQVTPENPAENTTVAAACAPLEAVYRLFDHRAREPAGDAGRAGGTGWAVRLAALQALRDRAVAGDPDRVGLLFADPAALAGPAPSTPLVPSASPGPSARQVPPPREPEAGPDTAAENAGPSADPHLVVDAIEAAVRARDACLIEVPSGATGAAAKAAVRRLIERLTGDGRRVLLLAPDEPALDDALQSLGADPGPLTVRIASRPESHPEPGSGPGSDPGAPQDGEPASVAAVVGTAHQAAWTGELQRLRRGLLWFEVWPQDRATSTAATAEHERLDTTFSEEITRLAGEVNRWQAAVPTAEQAAEEAGADTGRRADEHRRLAEESAALNAERDHLVRVAGTAEQTAVECARAAQELQDRCSALDRRLTDHRTELEQARQAEASLTADLARAHEALPQADAEVERLAEASAAADAEWHGSYYRLAAAESTLAAHRRKLSWGQRISMGSALKEHRHRVATRTREADRAAVRARQAKEAHDTAAAQHAALVKFITTGEADLAAAKATQERLVPEIVKLESELSAGRAEHEGLAGQATASAERAAAAATAADRAGQVAGRAEGLLAEAQSALRAAEQAAATATAGIEAAVQRLADSEAALRDKRAEAETALAASRTEAETAGDIEAVSRRHVEELCGTDPVSLPGDALAGHRDRLMAEVERLSTLLGPVGSEPAVLHAAELICATPAAFAAHPVAVRLEPDTLVVYDAGRVPTGDLLLGAVRTHHWILVGDAHSVPPADAVTYQDHVRALTVLRLAEQYAPGPAADDQGRAQSAAGNGAGAGAGAGTTGTTGTTGTEPAAEAPTRALPIIDLPDEGLPPGGAPLPGQVPAPDAVTTADPTPADATPAGHLAAEHAGAQEDSVRITRPLPIVDVAAAGPGPEADLDLDLDLETGPRGEPAAGPGGTAAAEPGAGTADPLDRALARLRQAMTGTDVGGAADVTGESGELGELGESGESGPDSRLPAVRAEAERIQAADLWEGRYRAVYLDVLDRLRQVPGGDAAGTELELQLLLDRTIDERLRRGSFAHIAAAAPALCHRLDDPPATASATATATPVATTAAGTEKADPPSDDQAAAPWDDTR